MVQHVRPAIVGLSKGSASMRINNPPEPANSRVGYFFWLNVRMAITRLAKPNIIINVSNTVKQRHPLSIGSMPTLVRQPFLLPF